MAHTRHPLIVLPTTVPRLIDYASRWDFVLDSHDLLVFNRGIHSLTLADVADGAGMSAATMRRLVTSIAAVHASSLRRIERRRARRHTSLPRTHSQVERGLAGIMIEVAVAPEHRQDDIVRQAILSVTGRDEPWPWPRRSCAPTRSSG
jgi:AcrR family transcriptional regulator